MKLLLIPMLIVTFAIAAPAQQRFVAGMTNAQVVPALDLNSRAGCIIVLNAAETSIDVTCSFYNLTSPAVQAHIHGNAAPGANSSVKFTLTGVPPTTSGIIPTQTIALTAQQVADMRDHRWYLDIHTILRVNGEVRGQVKQTNTVFDADGDGRTDIAVYRQSNSTFYTRGSLGNTYTPTGFGSTFGETHLNHTGDLDADGLADILLFKVDHTNGGEWKMLYTSQNRLWMTFLGNYSQEIRDAPVLADYDGDGSTDIAVFRRSTGVWYIRESQTFNLRIAYWGTVDDQPAAGDYDGDGKADLAVVRAEGNVFVWYILQSSTGTARYVFWGSPAVDSITPFAPFDVDGDGKQDIAVNRNEAGARLFLIQKSSGGESYVRWGASGTGSTPFFGDYDGDGKTDIVARRLLGDLMFWQILRSSDGQEENVYWGVAGDQ